jgi:NhaA family Na+:H+ antiporter
MPKILRTLLNDEAIGGKLIILASVLALVVANSSYYHIYENFWQQNLTIGINNFVISLDLSQWVSAGLMAIFFLVVGLEIKREVVRGELRRLKTASLPIAAAIGGMIVPACIFLFFNMSHPDNVDGWAIPIATDIAFALGVISLLGRRVSQSLKIFLLTLAIADDIGAIIIIAVFYGSGLSIVPLIIALLVVIFLQLTSKKRFMTLPLFVALGLVLWVAVYKSGIHPSIAGVLLGFLAPLEATKRTSIAESLERYTIPLSTFFIVPLFAFANLGIVLSLNIISGDSSVALAWGIIVGLVIGKVVGITLASWLLIKLKISELPSNSDWFQLIGVGFIAGIGFTVSIFITELAFGSNEQLTEVAKICIIIASTISAISGYLFLRHRKNVEEFLER